MQQTFRRANRAVPAPCRHDSSAASWVAQAKQLMRLLINHSLNGQELATRVLVRDLARLEDDEKGRAQ